MTEKNIEAQVRNLLSKNTRQTEGYQYTIPSKDTYPYQWLWDSCFHAIIYSSYDIPRAKDEIRALLSAALPNGLVPHMIYWERGPRINIDWGNGKKASTITQPPMIAYAIWRIYEKEPDQDFLKETYASLFHFYKYLLTDRDPHERRLIGLINPDESGEDNSPRFDELLDLPPIHEFSENLKRRIALVNENKKCNFDAPFCMKNVFWVKDVPFNAIMVENLHALARIAEKIGRSYDAQYFAKMADEVKKSMRELMLENGLYYSTFGDDYRKIRVETWATFSPLFAKIPSQIEAERLVKDELTNPEKYWDTYPITTVSKKDPSFSLTDMWRGPTWISINWFLYRGLMRYGFTNVAEKIREGSMALIEKSGFREYYHPHTGEGLGAHEFTWGGLVLDMRP